MNQNLICQWLHTARSIQKEQWKNLLDLFYVVQMEHIHTKKNKIYKRKGEGKSCIAENAVNR